MDSSTTSKRNPRRALGVLLLAVGLALLIEAAVTVAWREPLSALVNQREQGALTAQLRELESSVADELRVLEARPSAEARAAPVKRARRPRLSVAERAALVAESLNERLPSGDPVGRLAIRAIGLDSIVVQGAGTESLRKGPGHYSDTGLPGSGGTVAIGGHRTTFAAPFRRLDRLSRGDQVVLSLPYARFTYWVEGSTIVQPRDLRVLRRVRHERLVLTACHPLYSDAQRIVVFARLARTEEPVRLPF